MSRHCVSSAGKIFPIPSKPRSWRKRTARTALWRICGKTGGIFRTRTFETAEKALRIPLAMEMAATEEMVRIACDVRPARVCLVPEKRQELTTEGGLNVVRYRRPLKKHMERLMKRGIEISLFIEANAEQIEMSHTLGASMIELHTGTLRARPKAAWRAKRTARLKKAAALRARFRFALARRTWTGLSECGIRGAASRYGRINYWVCRRRASGVYRAWRRGSPDEGEYGMCGIVGYVGDKTASKILLEGLRRLEYRGYDSAGVAVIEDKHFELRRAPGKLSVLEDLLKKQPVQGSIGLGHTRWATHGGPTEGNAHPHYGPDCKVVVVHNGIIENYVELKKELQAKGRTFRTQTDTEVIAFLVEEAYKGNLLEAVRSTLKRLQGSYSIGVLAADNPDVFVAARKDSPLVLGIGENEMFLASDVPAILPHTRKVIFLEDGDIAEITRGAAKISTLDGAPVTRTVQTIIWDAIMAEKAGYKHFMLKEIYEQRVTVRDTFRGRINLESGRVELEDLLPADVAAKLPKVCIVACGTSHHAGLVSRFWFEELAGIPCDVEIASEYRYRRFTKEPGTLVIAITQSGETADTLAAMRDSKAKGLSTLAVCNAIGSTATRDAHYALMTHCGPEIGVASTKAFTGQLTALYLLALYIGQSRGTLNPQTLAPHLQALSHFAVAITEALEQAKAVEAVARQMFRKKDFLYLGRHLNYPIALEGALKLKEISYIHAEGYPAGEMKHGPIALIDENLPVVCIATASAIRDKMLSNIQEVKARGGQVIAVANTNDAEIARQADYTLTVPQVHEALAPIVNIIPLQFLAYYISVLLGCDVDQPRNLAKSVTVE